MAAASVIADRNSGHFTYRFNVLSVFLHKFYINIAHTIYGFVSVKSKYYVKNMEVLWIFLVFSQ